MFDVAFSELVVIAVVALIVVGPERLPKVARTLGVLIGRFQKMAQSFKDDLAREMPLSEIREVQQIKADLENQTQKITDEITAQSKQAVAEIQESLEELPPDFCGPPQKK